MSSKFLDNQALKISNTTSSVDSPQTEVVSESSAPCIRPEEHMNLVPSATGSTYSKESSSKDVQSSSSMSSTATSTDSLFLSSSPVIKVTDLQGTSCQCGQAFSGASCASNLKRHQRTSECGGMPARLECHDQGCNKTFTRSDNLRKHFREAHPFSTYPAVRQVQRKRKHIAQLMVLPKENLDKKVKILNSRHGT